MPELWRNEQRPGFFGRRRDEIIAGLNARWGPGNWRLRWIVTTPDDEQSFDFPEACKHLYEESYFRWLRDHPEAVEFITSYAEVYDNAVTNIQSGLDYERQEAYSTHIQDIAIRNALHRLGEKFKRLHPVPLQIRGVGEGAKYNPGHIPFFDPSLITQPSLRPSWCEPGMVEDLWQSNKWVQVRVP
jgi:hypothetical protein